MPNRQRVKVCFDCKLFLPIHPDNPESYFDENTFAALHNKHRVAVVGVDELNKDYVCVSRTSRDKALEELDKSFKQ